jgi:TATA-box binding protein (TBP) (component of TFIID and TFIIIB)
LIDKEHTAVMELREVNEDVIFDATPYKVSTITATGSVRCEINLGILFDNIRVVSVEDNVVGIIYIEYGKTKSDILTKGIPVKKKPKPLASTDAAPNKVLKRFDNQATIVMRLYADRKYFLNMKVFKNGNIQITGIKEIQDGKLAIDNVIAILKSLYDRGFKNIVNDMGSVKNEGYSVRLINSDFKINFEIRREILHQILVDDYGNRCTYEPCIYPGVKIQYYWNAKSDHQNGNCLCAEGEHCSGKGDGTTLNACKKITIAVFQSGCIIITGASTLEHIDDCYQYICYVLKENYNMIKKKRFIPLVPSVPKAVAAATTSKAVVPADGTQVTSKLLPPASKGTAHTKSSREAKLPKADSGTKTTPLRKTVPSKRKIFIKKGSIANFDTRKYH